MKKATSCRPAGYPLIFACAAFFIVGAVPPVGAQVVSTETATTPASVVGGASSTTGPSASMPLPNPHYRIDSNEGVSLNYVDTDIREIARLILGEILKVNYSIDPGFEGTVTVHTSRPLKRVELLPMFQDLLAQVGGQMTYDNGIYRISTQGGDNSIPAVVGTGSTASGSELVTLRYASAKQLAAMLVPYIGDGAKISVDPARNVLIVSGTATSRQNTINLIRVFDVDYLAGQSYAIFPAKYGDPTKFAADLQAALQLDNEGALTGAVKIVPIDEADAVLVITRQPAYLDRVSKLVEQLEKVKLSSGRSIHVYYLKNTQPSDLQPILQLAINPPVGGASQEIAPGNIPPTATPTQIGAAGANSSASSSMAARPPQASGAPSSGTPTPAAPASASTTGSTTQQVTGGDAKGVQIIADNARSALVVVATEAEWAIVEDAIRKLDVLPMQVLVEATVAEVTLNDALQYGVQFFLQNKQGQITLSNAQSASPTVIDPNSPLTNAELLASELAPNFPGFAITRTVGNIQGAIQALSNITDVQIISAPKLLILDKQPASLQVGDLVPIITQSATAVSSAGAPVVNNVAYQPTGVILTVTPQINSGGLVTLDINQEVSDVVPTTTSTINSPTFEQRLITTKVTVQDGETISLAGLISDKKTKGNSGVPFLQEIPVLGTLFSTKSNNDERTELLILLTPHVIHDQREARAMTEELKRKLAPGGIMP